MGFELMRMRMVSSMRPGLMRNGEAPTDKIISPGFVWM